MRLRYNFLKKRIQLNDPYDVAISNNGIIWVVDGDGTKPTKVRLFNVYGLEEKNYDLAIAPYVPTGFITLLNNNVAVLSATSGAEGVFVLVDNNSGSVDVEASEFLIGFPYGLATHPRYPDKIFYTSSSDNAIYVYDLNIHQSSLFASGFSDLRGMDISKDGVLYVCDAGVNAVIAYNINTGTKIGSFGTGILNQPSMVKCIDHLIYVVDTNYARVFTRFGGPGDSVKLIDMFLLTNLKRVVGIADYTTIVERLDGAYFAFGKNGWGTSQGYGIAGFGSDIALPEPVELSHIEKGSILQWYVMHNETTSVILTKDGNLMYAGSAKTSGNADLWEVSPTGTFQQLSNLSDIVMFRMCNQTGTIYAYTSDETLWAFGSGYNYALGNNSTAKVPASSPIVIHSYGLPKKPIVDIAVNPFGGAIVLFEDGTVWGWGRNVGGQLGLGNTTNKSTPVELPISDVIKIGSSADEYYCLKSDGLYAAGYQYKGALYDGNDSATKVTTFTLAPLFPADPSEVISIGNDVFVPGPSYTHVAFTKRGVIMVGDNTYGAFGLGDTTHRITPEVGHTDAKSVMMYGRSRISLTKTFAGTDWCWSAGIGYLGDGSTSSSTTLIKASQKLREIAGASSDALRYFVLIDPINLYMNIYESLGSPSYRRLAVR